eukprot:3077250-Alexandrium_andersonii.AAC.1
MREEILSRLSLGGRRGVCRRQTGVKKCSGSGSMGSKHAVARLLWHVFHWACVLWLHRVH